MPFEVFPHRLPAHAMPTVGIGSTSDLILSAAAWELLGSPNYCELLYDTDSGAIALRAAEESPDAFVLAPHGPGRRVAATRFLRHYGIEHRSVRFPAALEDGLLVVRFIEGEPIGRGRKPL